MRVLHLLTVFGVESLVTLAVVAQPAKNIVDVIFEHDWDKLAQRDIGTFQSAWSTNEAALGGAAAITSVLLGPKDYLPLV